MPTYVGKNFKQILATAVAAAFAFTMALFWNDAIRSAIEELLIKFQIPGSGYVYKTIVALIVTVVCAAGIWAVSRWAK